MARTILLIDDEMVLTRMLSGRFRQAGYDVLSARDGEEGFQQIVEKKPDLVITDLLMPKLTGHELVQRMKASNDLKKIPVIVLTGSPAGIESKWEGDPADGYMMKPFTAPDLLEKVRELLSKRNS